MEFYAHTHPDFPEAKDAEDHWELLFTPFGEGNGECRGYPDCEACESMDPKHGHLNKVAWWTAKFAEKIGFKHHGFLAGSLHDFGKYSLKFQEYLKGQESTGGDHSTAGAVLLQQSPPETRKPSRSYTLLSIVIASHHSGLFDLLRIDGRDGIFDRFDDTQDLFENIRDHEITISLQDRRSLKNEWDNLAVFLKTHTPFELGLLLKFFFSCLIDADRTATIAFKEGFRIAPDRDWPLLLARFNQKASEKLKCDSDLNLVRSEISELSFRQASREQGMFRLSLPTGSGKTLTSLRFALKHAERHNLDQIIYVVPFTTILDQNAQDARDFLERDDDFIVLEHHSNLSDEIRSQKKEGDYDPNGKLAENWDAPVIFTTMVQFLNALYKGGTKPVRRLHRLSNSIIIFDEVQSLPLKVTHLFNRAANFLTEYCKSTILLCTATQPILHDLPSHPKESLRLSHMPDLILSSDYNCKIFERYELFDLRKGGRKLTYDQLAELAVEKAKSERHILIIVNTKRDAQVLYQRVSKLVEFCGFNVELYFLSTDLCPAHRKDRIKELLNYTHFDSPKFVICISTNLVEAGVDLDFAVVFRAVAPLDSILQAAGRCNRHNKRPQKGQVYVVAIAEELLGRHLKFIEDGAAIAGDILNSIPADSAIKISDSLVDDYFSKLYSRKQNADQMRYPVTIKETEEDDTLINLLSSNLKSLRNRDKNPGHKNHGSPVNGLLQAFKTAGELFEVIPGGTVSILVPYSKGKDFIKKIRNTPTEHLKWSFLREAQSFSITVYRYQFEELQEFNAIELLDEDKNVYSLHESNYDLKDHLGLLPKKSV